MHVIRRIWNGEREKIYCEGKSGREMRRVMERE